MTNIQSLKDHLGSIIDACAKSKLSDNPTHSAKLEEARDIIDLSDDPVELQRINSMSAVDLLASYPLVAASIGIDGDDLVSCAMKIHKAGITSRARTALIERTRRLARQSINDCLSKDQCEAAYRSIVWPE